MFKFPKEDLSELMQVLAKGVLLLGVFIAVSFYKFSLMLMFSFGDFMEGEVISESSVNTFNGLARSNGRLNLREMSWVRECLICETAAWLMLAIGEYSSLFCIKNLLP